MESDTDGVSTPDEVDTTPGYPNGAHQKDRLTVITLQMEGTNERELEEGWKRDAVTMTEETIYGSIITTKQKPPTRGSPWRCTLDSAQGASLACRSYWP